jgi:hypothetical protein
VHTFTHRTAAGGGFGLDALADFFELDALRVLFVLCLDLLNEFFLGSFTGANLGNLPFISSH